MHHFNTQKKQYRHQIEKILKNILYTEYHQDKPFKYQVKPYVRCSAGKGYPVTFWYNTQLRYQIMHIKLV